MYSYSRKRGIFVKKRNISPDMLVLKLIFLAVACYFLLSGQIVWFAVAMMFFFSCKTRKW